MGYIAEITADKYPKQGDDLGKLVSVCFHYDLSRQFPGRIVRDDMEAPFRTIILLDDGRCVLGAECQWTHQK